MVEQEGGEKHQTSGEIKHELMAYLEDAEFGTPKYLALADFLNLRRLEEDKVRDIDKLAKQVPSDRDRLFVKSNLRIEESQIALLSHKIENNRANIPGYGSAYTNIKIEAEDFTSSLLSEEEKRPDHNRYYKDGVDKFYEDLWEEYFKREE